MSEYKACPFCGGTYAYPDESEWGDWIQCARCHATGPLVFTEFDEVDNEELRQKKAWEAWGQRAKEDGNE